MHLKNGDTAYKSALAAMRYWPEIQTAIGIRLDSNTKIKAASPFSSQLQMNGITRNPTKDSREVFEQRLTNHRWLEHWPKLHVND